ncbi:MAG: ATP-binding protein [Myxococcota bacterium]
MDDGEKGMSVVPSHTSIASLTRAKRALILLAAFAVQLSGMWAGHEVMGEGVGALVGLPVAAAVLLCGYRAGLVALVVAPLLSASFLTASGYPLTQLGVQLPGLFVGFMVVVGVHHIQATAAKLHASKARLKAVLGCSRGAVFEFDENGRYLSVWTDNEGVLAKPREEVVGRTITELIPGPQAEEFMDLVRKAFETGGPVSLEYPLTVIGGDRWFLADAFRLPSDDGSGATVACVVRDITERKRLMSQAVLADRVDGLGMTAASVAHELNNPLAYIHANMTYAMEELRASSSADHEHTEVLQALKEACEGVQRAESIVRDLRNFSRDDVVATDVDVGSVMATALRMASRQILARATVSRDIREVPPVRGSPARLGQVFLNLLTNAAQAIPEGNPKDHEVAVRITAAGDSVLVEVRDTGSGVPPELRHRIFDPFFTTKPAGVGTGLGLFVSERIVEEMGGRLEVESPGRGAVFRVVLPVCGDGVRATGGEAGNSQHGGTLRRASPEVHHTDVDSVPRERA